MTSEPLRTPAHHPSVLAETERRSADLQLRLADAITRFAGSMPFVYIHAVAFAMWMILAEDSPWPTLTLVVSLEAIFLSTFVMIGQNRQADFQQHKADLDFRTSEQELAENTALTRQIAALMGQVHAQLCVPATDDQGPAGATGSPVGTPRP
jgi:uncharacterized membrane protein